MEDSNSISAVPGPKPHWLFGLLKEFLGDTLGFLEKTNSEYGPISKFRILRATNYLVSDPELLEIIFQNKNGQFIKNTGFFRHFYDLFGSGLLTSEGEHWKKHRKLVAPVFQQKRLETYFQTMVSISDNHISEWPLSRPTDIHDAAMDLTADIAVRTFFGVKDYANKPKLKSAIKELGRQIAVRIGRPFVFQNQLPLPSNFKYKKSLNIIEETIQDLIEHYRLDPGSGTSILGILLISTYEDGESVPDQQIRDEALTLFLAGHETTAILISWTLYLLSQNPSAIEKLRLEWQQLVGGHPLTFAHFTDLRFTHAVVKETLRLYPPAYILGRQTTEVVKFKNYCIPKGAPIVISPYVQGRLGEYFHRPNDFYPERWLGNETGNIPKYAYIPFGAGPRTCIGEHFAKLEAVVILFNLLNRFDVAYTGDTAPEPLMSISMPPKDGMWMTLSLREK